jgi:hypothetical protein
MRISDDDLEILNCLKETLWTIEHSEDPSRNREITVEDLVANLRDLRDLRAAARAVVESKEEVHSVERGEGYLVCGAYLDALAAALGEGKEEE